MQTSKRFVWSAAFIVALALVISVISYAPAMAQDVPDTGNGAVLGNVSWDISGDIRHTNNEPNFDGLEVRIYNRDTGALVKAVTMGDDNYLADGLPDGRYRIEADSPSPAFVLNSSNLEFEGNGNWEVRVDLPFVLDIQKAIDMCRAGELPTWGRDGQFGTWQAPGQYAPRNLGEGWDEVCNLFPKPFKQVHVVVQTFTGQYCDDSIYASFRDDIWNGELQTGLKSKEMGFFEIEGQKEFYGVMRPGDKDLWAYDSGMHDCPSPTIPEWPTCQELIDAPADRFFSDQGPELAPFNVPDGTGTPNEGNAHPGIRDFVARVAPNKASTIDAVQCLIVEPCKAIRTRWYAGEQPWEAFLMAEKYDTAFSKPWRASNVWESGQKWDLPWDGPYLFANNEENICPAPTTGKLAVTKVAPTDQTVKFEITVDSQPSRMLGHGETFTWTVTSGVEVCVIEKNVDLKKFDVNIFQTSGINGPIVWAADGTDANSIVFPGTGPKVCTTVLPGETQAWTVTNLRLPSPPPPPVEKTNVYLPAVRNQEAPETWRCPAEAKVITVYSTREAAAAAPPETHGWVKFTLSGRAAYLGYNDGWAADPHTIFAYPVGQPRRIDLDVFFDGQQAIGEWQPSNRRNVATYRPEVSATHVSVIRVTNTENITGEVCVYLDPEQH